MRLTVNRTSNIDGEDINTVELKKKSLVKHNPEAKKKLVSDGSGRLFIIDGTLPTLEHDDVTFLCIFRWRLN